MSKGDYFMSRALLAEELRLDDSIRSEIKYSVEEPAKLTILADSSETCVLTLNRA
jgi:hypothetical protein